MLNTILIICLIPLIIYAMIDLFAADLPENVYQFVRRSKMGRRISWSVSTAIQFILCSWIASVFTDESILRLAIAFVVVAAYGGFCYWILNVYAKPKPGDRGYKP